MSIDSFIAAIASFEQLPVPGALFDLDGTFVAVNAAATRLMMRSAADLVGRKAWDFAPGAEHIWFDVIAAARTADYHGDITVATPAGTRRLHYVVSVRAHEGREAALLFAVEIPPAP